MSFEDLLLKHIYSAIIRLLLHILLDNTMKENMGNKAIDNKKDIETFEDIKLLVDSFYALVREDDFIGPIFSEQIQDRWPDHLNTMYTFWETLLLGNHTYTGKPFPPHAQLPIDQQHFERWLSLFEKTLNKLFSGKKTEEAIWRAQNIATMFQRKIKYIRDNPDRPLLT